MHLTYIEFSRGLLYNALFSIMIITKGGDNMNTFALKIIAIIAMTIDHTGAALASPTFDALFMRAIGRIAFPIYAFLIAEGCRKTRSQGKYLLRLGIFALISEIPFDIFFSSAIIHNFSFSISEYQNVFFTLALGAAACWVFTILRRRGKFGMALGFLCGAVFALAAEYLHTDYGGLGVALILALFLCENHIGQAAILLLAAVVLHGSNIIYNSDNIYYLVGMIVAVALILFYNGERGPAVRWTFYVYYPAHLLIIALVCLWQSGKLFA